MNILYLKYCPSSSPDLPNGVWIPEDHESNRLMLKHFSGGCIAISYDRLAEIVFVAGLHNVEVQTEGDPKEP